jgi:hypothetical protein
MNKIHGQYWLPEPADGSAGEQRVKGAIQARQIG